MSCRTPVKRLINGKYVDTPCRMCMGCRIARRTEWSNRLRFECAYYARKFNLGSSFVTVTYSDDGIEELRHEHMIEHLCRFPQGTPFNKYSLFFNDMSKMLKRLRSHIKYNYPDYDIKFKYYLCGEYGEDGSRPHFHFIFCGLSVGMCSEFLRKSWTYGYIKASPVTNARIRYTLKYMDKQIFGDKGKEIFEKNGLVPPHSQMSDGIGISYLKEFCDIGNGTYNVNGHNMLLNSYFRKKFNLDDSAFVSYIYSSDLLASSIKGLSLGNYRKSIRKAYEYSSIHQARLTNAVDDMSIHNFDIVNEADFLALNKLAVKALEVSK